MFKKTAIAFGLAIVTGSAFAASGMGALSDASVGAGASAGGTQAGMSTSGSLAAQFHKLDTNGDGVLSPSEAKADPTVAKLYDSMDNNASIKTDPHAKKGNESPGGITLNQFEAGMQAARGGAAGPAVSGGETYTVMKNGSKRMMPDSDHNAGNAMNRTQQSMQSAGQSMNNTASQMNQSAQDRMSGMQNNMQNGASQNRSNMQSQTDHMRNNAAQTMQQSGNAMSGNGMNANGSMNQSSTVQPQQQQQSDDNGKKQY